MPKPSIRLSPAARAKARDVHMVARAALEAFEAAGKGDIHFARFTAGGRQFALSTRTVIEVDWLPNRVPDKVLRAAGKILPRVRKTPQRT
jgi:hypothetical protein